MLSIIKLRLVKLRDEYKVFLIMTLMVISFTYILGTAQYSSGKAGVFIVDYDKSNYSQAICQELFENKSFYFISADYQQAIQKLKENKALAAVIIEEGFGRKLQNTDSCNPVIRIVKVKEDLQMFVLEKLLNTTLTKAISNLKIAEFTADNLRNIKLFNLAYKNAVENWKYKKPLEIVRRTTETNNDNGYNNLNHSMLGFMLFFSMFTMVFSIGDILNERQNNTWQRLLISPLSKIQILGGNLIFAFFIGFGQIVILIIAGKYLFNINWGQSILGILTIAASFTFATTSLGLMLSGFVSTFAQLQALIPLVLTSTAMLGGCMWPLEIVHFKPILFLANITPQKWAIIGMERIMTYGAGLEAALIPSFILICMGILFFLIGIKLIFNQSSV